MVRKLNPRIGAYVDSRMDSGLIAALRKAHVPAVTKSFHMWRPQLKAEVRKAVGDMEIKG